MISKEPVLSALTAFVGATLALLVAFGVDLSSEQVAAIGAWVVAAYAVGLIVRAHVSPVRR